jgi:hypothetical protein
MLFFGGDKKKRRENGNKMYFKKGRKRKVEGKMIGKRNKTYLKRTKEKAKKAA